MGEAGGQGRAGWAARQGCLSLGFTLALDPPPLPPGGRVCPQVKTADDFLADDVPVEDRGRWLWDLYRPSYIRAFNDAKDYKQDSGAKIEGTKKATADDFVSRGEFRLFNAMTLIYAAMYDAFSKVDGATEGLVETDEAGSDEEEDEEDDQRAKGAEKDAEKEKDGCGGGGGASESTTATSGGKLGDKESAEEAATDAAAGASPNGNVAADEDNGDGEDRRIDR